MPAEDSRRPPDPGAALRAPWHLAVVAGPDTGWCLGLGAEAAVVGRGGPGLPLTDPLVSRAHLAARSRHGRAQVRDLGSVNGTRLLGARVGRARRLTRRWREVGAGARVALGGTVLEVRERPARLAPPAPWVPAPIGGQRPDVLRLAVPLLMCLASVPLLLSSSAGGWRWAALAVPLAVVAVTVGQARRGRAEEAAPEAELPDPAALLLLASARPAPAGIGDALRVALLESHPGRRPRAARFRGPPTGRRSRGPRTVELRDGDQVALLGAPDDVAASARWLVCQLAAWHAPRDLALALPPTWRWAAALPHRDPDGDPRDDPDGGRDRGRHDDPDDGRHGVTGGGAPRGPWRLTVQEAPGPGGAVRPDDARPLGARASAVGVVLATRIEQVPTWCTRVVHVAALHGTVVPVPWAATLARMLADQAAARGPAAPAVPAHVPLGPLLGPLGALEHRWARAPAGLAAPLGVDAGGVVELDLAAAGPHALVAGTTGSGKSELALCWLLGLAVRYSPAALQLVLVDYKGGATFASLAGLPHTAGVLTDLEPAATARALASLRAEVRRRERLLAAAGARDLDAYLPGPRPPRLLVVVDEFRALTEEHPEVMHALVRLAAQGRSLGLHLVLATQRPGGAVGPDVRANLTVRLCLRVLEPADSLDVVGVPDAARLPALPGRALLRTDRVRELQGPWSGPGDEVVAAVLEAATRAWARAGGGQSPRPWAPELPTEVWLPDLVGAHPPAGPALPLARSDLPAEQRLGVWSWATPTLLVTGGPGTGRSEALRTLVASALAASVAVHVLAADPARFADLRGPALGTVVGADDPRRAARLIDLLCRGPARPGAELARQVLVVDDAEAVCEQLDLVAPGHGAALLARLVREARRTGVALALSGPPSLGTARWVEGIRTRLVLAPRDETEALLAGVPRGLRDAPGAAGRGVLLEPGAATVVQVARTAALDLPGARTAAPRLARLPAVVRVHELGRRGAGHDVALGLGGDDGAPVLAACGPGDRLLVAGPSGSGRTTALATVRAQLLAAGRPAQDLAPGPRVAVAPGTAVVLLDDLDRWPPGPLAELEGLLDGRRDVAVVAAARTEAIVAAYRGPLLEWRSSASLLVLRPTDPAAAHLGEVDLTHAVDRSRPAHPGLAVLVTRGRPVPVQVARP
ncbi:FtsK/SpoIIIE domain-containing protein [Georgenia sp. SYP-B2076]|uniref:FtsK/SpoIIIE domain-containing protein n=1 Tax=Georgenia sp. SYP-B2076 TaxID=2495881 RepID=UPI000F8D28F3|nr:FtsK/SpoIIIE domain-containing protein [Georgenia sp. SYP-B2076]